MSDNENVKKIPLNEESLSHYFDDGDLDEWLLDDDRFSHEFDETWNKNISLMENRLKPVYMEILIGILVSIK